MLCTQDPDAPEGMSGEVAFSMDGLTSGLR